MALCSFILSCASAQQNGGIDPINSFLRTQNLHNANQYILQRDKVQNAEILRLFNRGEGSDHIADHTDRMNYGEGLFKEKYWRKMYKEYAFDTIKKYWKNEDFPSCNFVLENRKGMMGAAFMKKYLGSGINTVIMLSDPIYYKNGHYALFYYNLYPFSGSSQPQLVVMKREKGNWILERIIGDYIYY